MLKNSEKSRGRNVDVQSSIQLNLTYLTVEDCEESQRITVYTTHEIPQNLQQLSRVPIGKDCKETAKRYDKVLPSE